MVPNTGPFDMEVIQMRYRPYSTRSGPAFLLPIHTAVAHAMARLWRDAVNNHGGDVTLTYLPDIRIKGNTHFPMSDLNNVQIADLMSKWLKDKGLDQ